MITNKLMEIIFKTSVFSSIVYYYNFSFKLYHYVSVMITPNYYSRNFFQKVYVNSDKILKLSVILQQICDKTFKNNERCFRN